MPALSWHDSAGTILKDEWEDTFNYVEEDHEDAL